MRENITAWLNGWWPKTRKSHPLSKLLRPWLEKRGLRKLAAAQSAAMILAVGVVMPPTHAFDYDKTAESVVMDASEVKIVQTERAYEFPVREPIGISQYFGVWHGGVDIRASRGSEVVAVADGVVVEEEILRHGYGEYLRIAHEGTMGSLYAHLNTIEVKVGERVRKGQVIGTVGTSGWATGPHLHFELSEGERVINPLDVI